MHAVVCSTMISWAMHVVGDWVLWPYTLRCLLPYTVEPNNDSCVVLLYL
jgi:hypothetical protein